MAKKKQSYQLAIYTAIFIFGAVIGVFLTMSMSHGDGHMQHSKEAGHHMHHETLEVFQGLPIPSVDITVHKDPKTGWNLQMETQNFVINPLKASGDHKMGEGHAHLYINGQKITRLYNEWYHIPELEKGENKIRVTLNSNDHKDYTLNGTVIFDSEVVEVR